MIWLASCSIEPVSTHSRPKAAAPTKLTKAREHDVFQHTAARRRLQIARAIDGLNDSVSTHSRPKAAAGIMCLVYPLSLVSTHSRPKAAAGY